MPNFSPALLTDARIAAAYAIFAGSYFVFALGKFPWMKITGSVANIIVLDRAAAEDVAVGFREFFRIGLPVTIATLSLGSVWLWITS